MMTNYTKKMTQQVAIPVLRERLRQQASELSGMIHHSVTRVATVEMAAFTEYDAEVERERELIEQLLSEEPEAEEEHTMEQPEA